MASAVEAYRDRRGHPEWAFRMFPAKIDPLLDESDDDTWWHGSNGGALLGSAEFPVARRELATLDNLVGT